MQNAGKSNQLCLSKLDSQVSHPSSRQAGPPSASFPRRLLVSERLTGHLTNRLAPLRSHSGPSRVFGTSSEMRVLCVDVSVLTSRVRRSQGFWVRAVGCVLPGGLCPGSRPAEPRPSGPGATAEPQFPGQPGAAGPEPPVEVNGGIENTLEKEVVQYDYYSSYFDIFLLAVFRFKVLILAYAVCRLRHWWAIACEMPNVNSAGSCVLQLTTAVTSAFLLAKVILSKLFSQGAFGYVLPIISFILAWIETWFLDFKVLPQEAEEENRLLIVQDASEREALIPGGLSDGQFYSPPESEAGSDEAEEKQDSEKPLLEL
ncbi:STARD3 N-terminal-like protein isoform X1 [Sapajus apella]|uniref:STARD3 N-terminal-like protein isoform X1 n=1 Tax=Sapajus apella TaxID=9515 RepID=A0A6J3IJE2_SAPAP|nr:STARD3 N-terminal-like protein isoform X1 [Sapajus apella]